MQAIEEWKVSQTSHRTRLSATVAPAEHATRRAVLLRISRIFPFDAIAIRFSPRSPIRIVHLARVSGIGRKSLIPLLAGQRLPQPVADRPLPLQQPLDLGLLGYFERVVNVDPEVAHGAFKLAVAE